MNTAAIAAAPAAAALQFPCSAPPPTGGCTVVRPGCLWLRMPLPYALDHINLWLLEDGDGWTIVDCGLNSPLTREAWDNILTTLNAPVRRVIVTHCHPDHFGLAGWLTRRFGVMLWMAQAEYLAAHHMYAETAGHSTGLVVELFASHGLESARQAGLSLRGNSYRAGVDDPPTCYRRLFAQEQITIGAHDWRVIPGYGHSPEHAALYCAGLDLLISGDMLLPRISTNVGVWALEPESDPVGLFLDSIDQFKPLSVSTLALPSHGLPFRGIHARIAQLHQHHQDRLREVMEECEQPKMASELLQVLFRRPLDMHQTFFAMGESIAHLNYLWHRGALMRERGADGIYRFRRTT